MYKKDKIEFVADFTEKIKEKELILVEYNGMTVKETTDLRRKLRETGGTFTVIKNTLLKRVLKNNQIEFEGALFKGMSAIVSTGENFSDSGKILKEAIKDEKLKIKGGYYDGRSIDGAYVVKLASIPSREVLYSMLVGTLSGPIANLAYALQGIAEKKAATSPAQSEEKSLNEQKDQETKLKSEDS